MEKINTTLTDEAKEQFKAGNIGITTAYETAKLPPEQQKEIAAIAAGEEVKPKDIAERVREKQQQEALDRAAKQVDQAVKKAEHATVRALQATVEAERAAETATYAKNVSVSDTKEAYTEKEFAIYNLRQLLLLADYMTHDDNLVLQDILCKATEKKGADDNG